MATNQQALPRSSASSPEEFRRLARRDRPPAQEQARGGRDSSGSSSWPVPRDLRTDARAVAVLRAGHGGRPRQWRPSRSPPFVDPAHPLGTDGLGQDMLSRLLDGARISLTVAFVVQLVVILIGVPIGAHRGLVQRQPDWTAA